MDVRRFADARAVLARAGAFLEAREAEHNLILGLLEGLCDDPCPYGHEPYLAVVEEGDAVAGAALRTPPWGLVLSELEDAAAGELVARDVHAMFAELPGVLGPKAAAARFAATWTDLTNARGRIAMAERIYRADAAEPPAGVAGAMRRYDPADRELVIDWVGAFADEAQPQGGPRLDPAEWLDQRLTRPGGGLVLWEDDVAVSLAGYGNPTRHGVRIGPVYTPPERRRQGYASALVAGVTDMLLSGGRRHCFLFTDLSNQTSNSIYQQVGYRPVTDVDQWVFDPS